MRIYTVKLWHAMAAGLVGALVLQAGCAMSKPRNVPARSSGWQPGSGWQSGVGQIPTKVLRDESREAFEAGRYDDALSGFLTLEETYPDGLDGRQEED